MLKWNFPEYLGYKTEGMNAAEIDNRESPLQTFVREICQNSVDAAVAYPVRVEFASFDLPASRFPDIDGLKHTLSCCLDMGRTYRHNKSVEQEFENRLKTLSSDRIRMLRVSDFNTTGLIGSNIKGSSPWNNVTTGTGISDKSRGSSGSHGRGKDSFFEVSDLHTVFFSTLDKDGIKASIGVSKQITYMDNGTTHESFGCYLNEQEHHSSEQLLLDPGFSRSESGTDIYVSAFSEYEDEFHQMALAVTRDFFVKILNKELVVSILGTQIDHSNIKSILNSLDCRDDEEKSSVGYTLELIDCYLKGPVKEFSHYSLYLALSEEFFYVTSVRKGMVIDSRFHKLPREHIIGLVTVDNDDASDLLLMSEDISHNSWKSDVAPQNFRKRIKDLILEMKTNIRSEANKLVEQESGPSKEAIGLNRYIPVLDVDHDKHEDVSRKEFLYDPIRDVKISKKKPVTHSNSESARVEKTRLPTAEEKDDPDTKPIHTLEDDPKPYKKKDDHVRVKEGDNENYIRQFLQINLKEVRSLCTDLSKKRYKVFYRCDKSEPYYLRAYIANGQEAVPIPVRITSAMDSEGLLLPVTEGRIGPLEPNGGLRTYVFLTIDYPISCAISVGGEV